MISFIIPTYNEKGNLATLLLALQSIAKKNDEFIFIDDSSPDGTGELIASEAKKDSRIHLIRREGKQGLASAYFRGLTEARQDLIVLIEADFPPTAEHLRKIEQGFLSGAAEVLSSRFIKGGGTKVGILRGFGSRIVNAIGALYLGVPIKDFGNALRGIRRDVFLKIKDQITQFTHPEFFTQLTYLIYKNKGTLVCFPVVSIKRTYGVSKTDKLLKAAFRYFRNLKKIKYS